MGMTPVHVNIASDESEGTSIHLVLPPAGASLSPSKEVRIDHGWRPGASKHKITSTVSHRKRGIVQEGHDCGALIADLAPPWEIGYGNGNLPRMLMMSSRKVMFGASSVKAEGTAIGGAHTVPNLPMLSCGEPLPIPHTHPLTNSGNTVLVGFSKKDIKRGWENIVDAITVELICLLVAAGQKPPETETEVVGGIFDGTFGRDPVKSLVSAGVGLARSVERSAESGWTEPISLKVETGGGAAGVGVEGKWTPATGEAEVSGEIGSLSEKRTAGAKRGADGTWKGTGAVPPDLFL